MKVTREKAVFAPVVITIETQKELDELDAQLDVATKPEHVVAESPLFDLWVSIRGVK